MANAFGSQIVNIFGDTALAQLGQTLPVIGAYATDISTIKQPYGANSTITVKTFSTAGTYDFNGSYTSTDITGSDTVVTLNRHKVAERTITQDQLSSPYINVTLAEVGKEMGQSLAEAVSTDFLSLLNSGSFANFTVVNSASFNRNALNSIAATLSKRGVAKANRSLVINNDFYNYLSNDQSYVTLLGLNPDVVYQNQLPQIAGFQPYEMGNPLFPVAAYSASGSVKGFVGNKSGIAYATRIVPTLGEYAPNATYGTSINEKLGLAITNTVVADPISTGNLIIRSEVAYGFAVGNSAAVQVLIG